MVKEALGGEEYTLGNFIIANAEFAAYAIRGLLQNVCNIGTAPGSDLESHNKMDLFLRTLSKVLLTSFQLILQLLIRRMLWMRLRLTMLFLKMIHV